MLWHVSVTFAGPRVPRQQLHAALVRLVEAQPFPATVRYNDERAEISYWDEAEDVDDAAALGLRMWAENRRTADLPAGARWASRWSTGRRCAPAGSGHPHRPPWATSGPGDLADWGR